MADDVKPPVDLAEIKARLNVLSKRGVEASLAAFEKDIPDLLAEVDRLASRLQVLEGEHAALRQQLEELTACVHEAGDAAEDAGFPEGMRLAKVIQQQQADLSALRAQLEQGRVIHVAPGARIEHDGFSPLCPLCRDAVTNALDALRSALGSPSEAWQIAQRLADLDWCIGYELTESNSMELDYIRTEALRLLGRLSAPPARPADTRKET